MDISQLTSKSWWSQPAEGGMTRIERQREADRQKTMQTEAQFMELVEAGINTNALVAKATGKSISYVKAVLNRLYEKENLGRDMIWESGGRTKCVYFVKKKSLKKDKAQ